MAFCTPPLRRSSLCEPPVSGSTSGDAGRSVPTVLLTNCPGSRQGQGLVSRCSFLSLAQKKLSSLVSSFIERGEIVFLFLSVMLSCFVVTFVLRIISLGFFFLTVWVKCFMFLINFSSSRFFFDLSERIYSDNRCI